MIKAGNFIDKQVGARVRALREAASVSVYDCAVLICVSVEKFARLEAGGERFQAPHLRALAERFGVGVSKVFDGIESTEIDGASRSNVVPLFSVLH